MTTQSQDVLSISELMAPDTKICTPGFVPELQKTAYQMLGKVSTPENLVLLIFCHICARSIRPFQVLSVFITCYISSKVKAFNTAWVPMKLMNSSTTDGVSC